MSRHFVHRYKHSHQCRKAKLFHLIKCGKAKIVESNRDGWLIECDDNYRISNRGRLVKE